MTVRTRLEKSGRVFVFSYRIKRCCGFPVSACQMVAKDAALVGEAFTQNNEIPFGFGFFQRIEILG